MLGTGARAPRTKPHAAGILRLRKILISKSLATMATASAVPITKHQPQQHNIRQPRKRLAHSITRGCAYPAGRKPVQPAREDGAATRLVCGPVVCDSADGCTVDRNG